MATKFGKKQNKQGGTMEIYKCYVPRNDYYKVKNVIAIIYDNERPKYLQTLTDAEQEEKLAKEIRKRYTQSKGIKTLYEVVKEYREELRTKKEG